MSLGHCHPVVVEAIEKQARTLIHVSNAVYSVPQLELAQLLVDNSLLRPRLFRNSGAEANEAAIKLARKWGREHKSGAYEIITPRRLPRPHPGGGDGDRARAATTSRFGPLPAGFIYVPFNDLEALQQATTPRRARSWSSRSRARAASTCPTPATCRRCARWCDENNMLLIFDEVQTGMGRTGPLFAYQQYGRRARRHDAGEGPRRRRAGRRRSWRRRAAPCFTPGDHGSTFGGNPLTTAVALAVTRYMLDNNMAAQVEARGEYLAGKLRALSSATA